MAMAMAAAPAEGLPRWSAPTTFPHVTNFRPALRSRNRRGSILRSMSKHMEVRVAVIGLSGAGKSTLVEQLAQEDGKRAFISTTPTTPYEGRMELHQPSDAMRMMIWDMNGRPEARHATWYDQIERCDALVYVFDCGDLGSLDEASAELVRILVDERLDEQMPLLIWANKMDVEGSITESELSERLALWTRPDCARRQWCIQGSVMHDRGLGVEHGMKWLYLTLSQKQSKKWTSTERYIVENEQVAEVVTPTRPNAKPVVSAASQAKQSSSAGLHSTTEAIVEEEGDEEEESDEDETQSQITRTLFSSVPLLQNLDEEARRQLAEDVTMQDFRADKPIVIEGEEGNVLFLVEQGQANVVIQGQIVKQYFPGDFFGELALAEPGARRKATVLAGAEGARCVLLGKPAFDSFSSVVADILEERRRTYAFARSTLSGSARTTLSGSGTRSDEIEEPVWNTPYVANFEPAKAKPGKGREFRVLVAGMEDAGKTTFMMQLEKKTAITWASPATPIVGKMTFQKHREHSLIVWDMNGSAEGRANWESHVESVGSLSGIIYVVDATAKYILTTARLELERMMRFKTLDPSIPLLIIANKMDAEKPLDSQQVAETMALQKIRRRWRVQECSATLGTGVEQAVDWLCLVEGVKPRKHERDLLAEENSRLLCSAPRTSVVQSRHSAGAAAAADADIPAYQVGSNYRVTKRGGKGKGQQLKLSCGAMGVNTFKMTGEHVKSYPYKELADWAQGTYAGREMVTLFKRDRNVAGTEFVCEAGDASRIVADLNRMVRGATPIELVAQSTTISSPQRGDVSKSLAQAQELLWAAIEVDEQDLAAIAALGTEVEILSGIASREATCSDETDGETPRQTLGQPPPPQSPVETAGDVV